MEEEEEEEEAEEEEEEEEASRPGQWAQISNSTEGWIGLWHGLGTVGKTRIPASNRTPISESYTS